MFNRKKMKLKNTSANKFIAKGLQEASKTTNLGNGAVKYTTTGNAFVDQFGKATNYRNPRTFQEVSADMEVLWNQNPLMAVCMIFYLRMVTRVTNFFDGSSTKTSQKGQGLKNEGMMRMLWLAIHHPDTFFKNIHLYIAIASWKDIFQMLSLDLQYHEWERRQLDWNKFGQIILAGLENPNTVELVKKYLPQIKSKSNIKTVSAQANTMVGKWLCSLIFGGKQDNYKNYKKYRKLKASGAAHEWQQLISQRAFEKLDFKSIHGRALQKLVGSKFLANQGLEVKYANWIEAQPTAKYTGYVYELMQPLGTGIRMSKIGLAKHQISTMNKQFMELVAKAKDGVQESRSYIGVLDTSASMTSLVPGTKVSAYSVGKSLTLFLSYLLEGTFSNYYLEFSDETILKQWKGDTPVDKLVNDNSCIVRSTNFQSVATHFVNMLKRGVPESDFPTGIVCFSDGCFNQSGKKNNKTNFRAMLKRLQKGGFSTEFVNNFQVILWDIPNAYYGNKSQTAFEGSADTPNLFHVSGLDGSALALLTGNKSIDSIPTTSEELMQAALSQEVMQMITI